MEIKATQNSTHVLLEPICVKIDAQNSQYLRDFVESNIAEINAPVIFDMKNIQYVDSSGVGALLMLYRTCLKYKVKLVFTSLSETVSSVLSISKLDSIFTIINCKEQAAKSV
jgi:anti-sigma B factor antagonist